jgi:hypothetical protein
VVPKSIPIIFPMIIFKYFDSIYTRNVPYEMAKGFCDILSPFDLKSVS